SPRETDGLPIFYHNTAPDIGELSVHFNSFLNKWILLFNSGTPRGINFRVADRPWGPWSPSSVLFNPDDDRGYGYFMHSLRVTPDDGLSDPDRIGWWGGEYGPYVIPSYLTGDSTSTTLYYAMSINNPYQVVLMKS